LGNTPLFVPVGAGRWLQKQDFAVEEIAIGKTITIKG
jgi:hypothetical protein